MLGSAGRRVVPIGTVAPDADRGEPQGPSPAPRGARRRRARARGARTRRDPDGGGEAVFLKLRKRWYTPAEVAERVGVSRQTVVKWIERGELDAELTPGGHHRIPAARSRRAARWSAPTSAWSPPAARESRVSRRWVEDRDRSWRRASAVVVVLMAAAAIDRRSACRQVAERVDGADLWIGARVLSGRNGFPFSGRPRPASCRVTCGPEVAETARVSAALEARRVPSAGQARRSRTTAPSSIKRVVAVGGERVKADRRVRSMNGKPLERALARLRRWCGVCNLAARSTVPPGQLTP